MRFKVPQFIEVEDKIFGPLTFRQFVYLVGGGGLSFIVWRLLPTLISILFIIPIVALAVSLAFYKPNDRPFIQVLESAIKFLFGNKLYLWKHDKRIQKKKFAKKEGPQKNKSVLSVPKMSTSKLKDLSWELDIKDSIYSEETKPR